MKKLKKAQEVAEASHRCPNLTMIHQASRAIREAIIKEDRRYLATRTRNAKIGHGKQKKTSRIRRNQDSRCTSSKSRSSEDKKKRKARRPTGKKIAGNIKEDLRRNTAEKIRRKEENQEATGTR